MRVRRFLSVITVKWIKCCEKHNNAHLKSYRGKDDLFFSVVGISFLSDVLYILQCHLMGRGTDRNLSKGDI